jgi:diguanylate cyclase (GGDEF)-like protein
LLAAALGLATYKSAEARSSASFRASAKLLSSALLTALWRDTEFVSFQQGLLSAFPNIDNHAYYEAIGGQNISWRYPGGVGFGFVERVPRASLHHFAEAAARDPLPGVPPPSPAKFTPFPPGQRPVYCLFRTGWYAGGLNQEESALIESFDFCAPVPGAHFPSALALAERTRKTITIPPMPFYPHLFFLVAPVYQAARASGEHPGPSLMGWAIGTFNGEATLRSALRNISGFKVALSYAPPGAKPVRVASFGATSGGQHYVSSFTLGTPGRWFVGVAGGVGSSAASQSVLDGSLVAGIALLLFMIVRLLAGSRERALALVEQRTAELRHQALHDALTGLPNRALVADRANQMLATARRSSTPVGALFVDLDNFKWINDSFGHQCGDELLRAVAERLTTAVRQPDVVGRLGGDEFIVLVQGSSLEAGAEVIARRLLDVLAEPFVLQGMEHTPLSVAASIGIATGPRANADELLRDADVALYKAKQAGKGRYVIFHPQMQVAVQDRLALEIELRRALERDGEFYVEYQPIFDLTTAEMTSAEALLRWRHPERGLIEPSTFIPIAEETGLVVPLGRLVLNQSCRQAGQWVAEGLDIPVSVNVSGHQLAYEGFPSDVAAALAQGSLAPHMLTLELTETALMHDAEAVAAQLAKLKDMGVRVAIDDFGTGYSPLTYLRVLPVDSLKIDRSFVAGMTNSPQASAIVNSLVQLGKKLGLDVVAEGIEEPSQLARLRQQRCDLGQGFVYSRPVGARDIERLWRQRGRPAFTLRH